MIVDDDAQLLDILRVMLQPWGFQITLLSDCQQFWQTLDKVRPDLLMLDIEIPKINGIDLCQLIRNDLHWGDLPILMISANTDDETIQRVFMAGADDYVSKPIRAAELVARVIRRLEHANVLKKLRTLGG
nr:response regulator [Nostoc sp. UIC 10630]